MHGVGVLHAVQHVIRGWYIAGPGCCPNSIRFVCDIDRCEDTLAAWMREEVSAVANTCGVDARS